MRQRSKSTRTHSLSHLRRESRLPATLLSIIRAAGGSGGPVDVSWKEISDPGSAWDGRAGLVAGDTDLVFRLSRLDQIVAGSAAAPTPGPRPPGLLQTDGHYRRDRRVTIQDARERVTGDPGDSSVHERGAERKPTRRVTPPGIIRPPGHRKPAQASARIEPPQDTTAQPHAIHRRPARTSSLAMSQQKRRKTSHQTKPPAAGESSVSASITTKKTAPQAEAFSVLVRMWTPRASCLTWQYAIARRD